ncbi:MAG: enoyl-CoA hydratase/isomerase family protein [Pseudomonadota bacterium]
MSQHEAPSYKYLELTRRGRALTVTIDHPPINLIAVPLAQELSALVASVAADDTLTVLRLKSANPEFFLAHFDVEAILSFPTDTPAEREQELNWYHQLCERLRTMNKVTIAQIEGRVGGGGSEIAASCDMRFGVPGQSTVCQMEVPLGILPGGSGTQRLPRLVGRGRALEIILAGDDIDAETAERWGYFNRLFPAGQIDAEVEALADRIASFPPEAVRLAKRSVDASSLPIEEGLREEAYLFQRLLRTDGAQRNMRRFLERGGQTRAVELRVGAVGAELGVQPD